MVKIVSIANPFHVTLLVHASLGMSASKPSTIARELVGVREEDVIVGSIIKLLHAHNCLHEEWKAMDDGTKILFE